MSGFNNLFKILVISYVTLQTSAQEPASDKGSSETKLYPVEESTFNMYKEKVCATIPQFSGNADSVSEWNDELTEAEVYELALVNLAHDLTTGATAHLPVSLGWRKELVDYMADITLRTCDSVALSNKYVSGVKNLFLYYLHKMSKSPQAGNETSAGNDTQRSSWEEIISHIYTCSNSIDSMPITEVCGRFVNYVDTSGVAVPMMTIPEQVDEEVASSPGSGFDIIIDSVWWMFSVTYARCYRFYYPNEDIILKFYSRFRDEFLTGLHLRWVNGGERNIDWFSIILGPVEVQDEWQNIRKCASAAYDYEGMSGRQLVRPLMVTVGNQIMKNHKIL